MAQTGDNNVGEGTSARVPSDTYEGQEFEGSSCREGPQDYEPEVGKTLPMNWDQVVTWLGSRFGGGPPTAESSHAAECPLNGKRRVGG